MNKLFLWLNLLLLTGCFVFGVMRPIPANLPSGSMGFYVTENLIVTFLLMCVLLGINILWLMLFFIKKVKSKN
jgi:hypothetical protein